MTVLEVSPSLLDWLRSEWPRGLSGGQVRSLESRLRRAKEDVTWRGHVVGLHFTRATNQAELFVQFGGVASAVADWEEVKAFLLASPWDRRGR